MKQKDLANGLTSWECIERREGNFKVKVKLNAMDDFVENTLMLCLLLDVSEPRYMRALTHFSPMSHFYTPPPPHFSDVFRGVQKCDIGLKWVKTSTTHDTT